MCFSPSLLEIF